MPSSLWGEVLLHSTFLINRLPTKFLSWKTPFEILFKRSPNYNLIKNFGCLTFATNILPQKDKLAPRAKACVFLGFQTRTKGFKLYDLNARKIIITRNAKFHETVFSYIDYNFENNYVCPSLPLTPNLQDETSTEEDITTQTTTPSEVDTGSSSSGIISAPLR